MNHLCTLFDRFYLDKGLALHRSLLDTGDDFTLFIFAFDDICYDILVDMKLDKAEVISLKQFETEDLLKVKQNRTKAEYCWTCTPWVIRYVLDHYNVDMCTYIDADLFFFQSPDILLTEIRDKEDSVIITEHRFKKDHNYEKLVQDHGKYCVEFNTFKNDEKGNLVLNWWKDRCLEWCYFTKNGDLLGDQKYLDKWTSQFEGIHELQNLGGGVAPWNLDQYNLCKIEGKKIKLIEKISGNEFDLIFYHFQNLRYITNRLINIKSGTKDRYLKYSIYFPYLTCIEQCREMLKNNYSITFETQKSCSGNKIISFIQRNFMQFKCKSLSDIIDLKKI
ncbi:hypothetical protein [Sinanaerobacter chloroacetimidivorans]|uniref:Glycosyl transferase n=1 Tax=Sinanaerobacter chloroacetimidivorans TaxID=2818044 RepID=A0A8J7W270_9FIRM|nr:hypothetical protein [Sinanaerobacter chloroacetimidivorans]MBR0599532.1 hypothetical protein [Sinanaerobacter chloroacetimidivorans]